MITEQQHTRLCQISETMLQEAYRLGDKAEHFLCTGNVYMYEYLLRLSAELQADSKELRDITGAIVADGVHSAWSNSINVLNGVLAGVQVAEKDAGTKSKRNRKQKP